MRTQFMTQKNHNNESTQPIQLNEAALHTPEKRIVIIDFGFQNPAYKDFNFSTYMVVVIQRFHRFFVFSFSSTSYSFRLNMYLRFVYMQVPCMNACMYNILFYIHIKKYELSSCFGCLFHLSSTKHLFRVSFF